MIINHLTYLELEKRELHLHNLTVPQEDIFPIGVQYIDPGIKILKLSLQLK